MLQVARLAPTLLGDSRDLVRDFLARHLNPDGGFQDRQGRSDLYYTVFGLEALRALREPVPPQASEYLRTFGSGEGLDLVHLTCLARAWRTAVDAGPPGEIARRIRARLETFRSGDGGYATTVGAECASVYGCFIAVGAIQDLGAELSRPEAVAASLAGLRAGDGGFANHPEAAEGSTPATAAAVVLQRHLDVPPDSRAGEWLLARCHRDGGFFAAPRAPLPDLLSTATALHALVSMHASIEAMKEPCLDFVDTLWTNDGGFCGSWADPVLDCEYTYYGLLALGHLSL